MIAIDFSKQQALDDNPKVIQQINYTGNLSRKDNQDRIVNDNTTIFFTTKEAKETVLVFSQGTVKVLWTVFLL